MKLVRNVLIAVLLTGSAFAGDKPPTPPKIQKLELVDQLRLRILQLQDENRQLRQAIDLLTARDIANKYGTDVNGAFSASNSPDGTIPAKK